MEEVEAKILDIDEAEVRARLAALGAQQDFDGELEARYYDTPDRALHKNDITLRLRREGDAVVLACKTKRPNAQVKIAEEIETSCADMETTHAILTRLGFVVTLVLRKHRTQWVVHGGHVVIDTFTGDHAGVPPFLEIEAHDTAAVHRIAALLGYTPAQCLPWSGKDVLKHYHIDR